MKKILPIVVLVLFCFRSGAQLFHEDFEVIDSVITTSSTGLGGFYPNTRLHVSGIVCDSASVITGDTTILMTYPIDLSANIYAILHFKHICKIDFFDRATVWVHSSTFGINDQLTAAQMTHEYGDSTSFSNMNNTFQEATWGSAWQPGVDTLPDNSWWKSEYFDISLYSGIPDLQIVFKLEDSNNPGGNNRAGWFIDDVAVSDTLISIPYYFTNLAFDTCSVPHLSIFNIGSYSFGLFTNDSMSVHLFFGDGNDTLYTIPYDSLLGFHSQISHLYNFPGIFSTQVITVLPNGNTDTINSFNTVVFGTGCGSITGKAYIDYNNDCIYNGTDVPIKYFYPRLNGIGINNLWGSIDLSGNYTFYNIPINTYTIDTPSWSYPNTGLQLNCPVSGSISISAIPSYGNDFSYLCNPGYDISSLLGASNSLNQNGSTHLLAMGYNQYCDLQSGILKIVLDTNINFNSSYPNPQTIVGDTLFYAFSDIYSSKIFQVLISISADSSLTIGDIVCFSSIVESITDSNSSNNIRQTCLPISAPYDPNNKLVEPQGNISQNQQLSYIINFQNTGTAPAHNVFILDTISQNLDLNTLQILGSSHNMTVDFLPNNLLKFNFNNIMLPDSNANEQASHGFVSYTIKPKPSLANGSSITNGSHIYFDWNLPVATNITLNTIDTTVTTGTVQHLNQSEDFNVFPNPANDLITISIGKSSKQNQNAALQVVNAIGETVMNQKLNSESTAIDIRNLSSGIYLFRLICGNKIFENRKVIIY